MRPSQEHGVLRHVEAELERGGQGAEAELAGVHERAVVPVGARVLVRHEDLGQRALVQDRPAVVGRQRDDRARAPLVADVELPLLPLMKPPSIVKFLPCGCVMRIGLSAGRRPKRAATVASSKSSVWGDTGTTPVSSTASTLRSSRSTMACTPSMGRAKRLMPVPAVLYICAFTMRRFSSGSPNEPGVSGVTSTLASSAGVSMPRRAIARRKPASWNDEGEVDDLLEREAELAIGARESPPAP